MCDLISLYTGSDSGAIRLRHPKAYQTRTGEGNLHLCRRGPPPHGSSYERYLRGAQVSLSVKLMKPNLIVMFSRDEDNFLYVSYSGENTFGEEFRIEL